METLLWNTSGLFLERTQQPSLDIQFVKFPMVARYLIVYIFLTDIPKLRLSSHTDWEGSGLVEVFINGQWGLVCDNGWDFPNAEVVCRQLGYPGAEMSTCCGWYFGRGSGPPLMDNVRCNGKESSIFHCPHRGKDEASCSRRQSAGVVCKLDKPNGK